MLEKTKRTQNQTGIIETLLTTTRKSETKAKRSGVSNREKAQKHSKKWYQWKNWSNKQIANKESNEKTELKPELTP